MEIFCVQKRIAALAALVQLAGLEFAVGYDCSTGGDDPAAADSEYYAGDILAGPIAMFFVRT